MRSVLLMLVLAVTLAWIGQELKSTNLLEQSPPDPGRASLKITTGNSAAGGELTDPEKPPKEAAPPGPPPLFRPAVSPFTPPPPPKAGESYTLVGIVGRADAKVAYLRDKVDGRSWKAGEGGAVDTWKLEKLDGRCVTLRQAKRSQQVCL